MIIIKIFGMISMNVGVALISFAALALSYIAPEKVMASEQAPEDLGVVLGTAKNFMDYFTESMEELEDQGADTKVSWPQSEYESGLGFINVLPEFSADLGLALGPLFLLDLPIIPFEYRFYISTPEIPANNRKVVGITESDGFTDSHIPPLRWSADGRLGVESQVGGSLENPSPVSLYLFAPEKLSKPFVESPAGPVALVMDKVELPFSELAQGRTGSIQHTNICDPYVKNDGERRNPYSCGVGGKDDCYDVTLVSAYVRLSNTPSGDLIPPKLDNWDRIMGTPLSIRVSNPKTVNARIEDVSYGETKFAPKRGGVLFETITPADGRLFVARRGFLPLVWQNNATGKTQFGSYDVVYGIAPSDAEPCDVSYWGDLYPITHAPYDERLNTRYPFAMQPFRDPSGAIIPDGVDIKGTYPWMDKEAKNFSVQVSGAKLFPTYTYDGNTQSRYPLRCVSDSKCSTDNMRDSDNSKDNMFALMGAWTQGKMVLVDGMLNDVDFRLGGRDKDHSYLALYQSGTGKKADDTGEVRVGSTRGGTIPYPVFGEEGELVGRYQPANLSMLDSIENRLNYLPNIKPSRFHDVVWNMSSGHSTVEFSFDDYLNPDGFIVSNMVAHMQHQSNHWYRMNYYDGWHQLTRSFNGQVRVQNSATALPARWKIPSFGRVYNGRMEPVANGGIRGKGMWLNGGTTRIDYEIAEQPQTIYDNDWFYSLFIDPRFDNDRHERILVRFPDKSHLTLKGRGEIRFYNSVRKLITSVDLPFTLLEKDWSHLALLVDGGEEINESRKLSLYVNGFPYYTWEGTPLNSVIEKDNFRPVPGTLRLGKESRWGGKRGFKGWMDEFKVVASEPNLETICNFGHGSLVGLPNGYNGALRDIANLYQTEYHDAISRELNAYGQPVFSQYVCYSDYSGDNKAHLNNIPRNVVGLRDAINFPEGPLYHDAPRPDSSSNRFCLSCHYDEGIAGLGLDALHLNSQLTAKQDFRRQPTQSPAKIYGNVPANWFPGAPSYGFVTGEAGAYLDEWTLSSSVDVSPEIRNIALADENGEPWRGIGEGESIGLDGLPETFTHLRANVSGLVRSVVFDINGYQHFDDSVPFTVSKNLLNDGSNEITVTAYDGRGESASLSVSITVVE